MLSCKYANLSSLKWPFWTNIYPWLEKSFKKEKGISIKILGCSTFHTKVKFQRTNNVKGIGFCNYSTQVNKSLDEKCVTKEVLQAAEEAQDVKGKEAIQENTEDIFNQIAKGDPNIVKQLKILEFEINVLREHNRKIPKKLKMSEWKEFLLLKTTRKKLKYLEFLFLNEMKKQNYILKKEKISETRRQQYQQMEDEGHMMYGLAGNTMFYRLYERTLNMLQNERLMGAKMFSQTVVFDCSYESYMSRVNSKYCAQQLLFSLTENRRHPAPFNIEFCNAHKDSLLMTQFQALMPNLYGDCSPWDIHTEHYLDLYPKDKLVYLTPHCGNEMQHFNHEDIYIIGAFVDKGTGVKASLAKAKKDKLRMAKLPLDSYLIWEMGMKSLAVNIVLKILLDRRLYRSWDLAFQNVPRRFLQPQHERQKVKY